MHQLSLRIQLKLIFQKEIRCFQFVSGVFNSNRLFHIRKIGFNRIIKSCLHTKYMYIIYYLFFSAIV